MTSQFPQSYNKSFKTIDEQIELLKSRGVLFRDESQAKHHLLNLNNFHSGGYEQGRQMLNQVQHDIKAKLK